MTRYSIQWNFKFFPRMYHYWLEWRNIEGVLDMVIVIPTFYVEKCFYLPSTIAHAFLSKTKQDYDKIVCGITVVVMIKYKIRTKDLHEKG